VGETELLPTIAEVAVAIAGFASLISVVGARRRGDQLQANLTRLRGMLETSLLAAAFAFLPFIPFKFGVSAAMSWRSAAAAFALVAFSRSVLMRSRNIRQPTISLTTAYAIGGSQTLAALVLLVSSLALPETQVVGSYHLLLFIYLLTSIYLFMRVAISVISSDEPAV
jgi:hypothetical protein